MTTSTRLLSLLALVASLLTVSSVSATDAAPPAAPPAAVATTPPPAPTLPISTLGYKDQFLGFVLTKAEKYSGKVEDAMGTAVDAAMREMPTLARQFLTWRMIDAALTILIPFVIGIPFALLFAYCFPKWMAIYKDPNRGMQASWGGLSWTAETCSKAGRYIPCSIIGLLGTVISLGNVANSLGSLHTIAEIYFAPHVYLMEQALALVQKHG